MSKRKPVARRTSRLASKAYIRARLKTAVQGGPVESAAVEAMDAALAAHFDLLLARALARREREERDRAGRGEHPRAQPPLTAYHVWPGFARER